MHHWLGGLLPRLGRWNYRRGKQSPPRRRAGVLATPSQPLQLEQLTPAAGGSYSARSNGPPGGGGRRAREGREGSLVRRSGGRVPAAGWAAKQGATGEGEAWGVPAGRGRGGGGAPLEASCRGDSSSMGRLGGKAASGAGGSRGLAALQGAGWLAATASRRWAVPAATMWLAIATTACSTVPCKCCRGAGGLHLPCALQWPPVLIEP